MSSAKESLVRSRENYIAALEQISNDPKPTYSIDGESWSWVEYQTFLIDKISTLKTLITSEDDDDIVEELSEMI